MLLAGLSSKNLQKAIEESVNFQDSAVIPHLGKILSLIDSEKPSEEDLVELSNLVKQSEIATSKSNKNKAYRVPGVDKSSPQPVTCQKKDFEVKNFVKEAEKLEICGISFGQKFNQQVQRQVIQVIQKNKLSEGRFWGKINGISKDYYVIQGYRIPPKQHSTVPLGSEKQGQGVNCFVYYVTNDVYNGVWDELPIITQEQITISRRVKRAFTGDLNSNVNSYPSFPGKQRHYLKCQIARITHSLQIEPKGIHKVHDENPKVTEYEEEVKIPDFSELSTLEGWVHRNPMILKLGRCTHFVDPSLGEEQIEAITSELAEKDPEIERLRAISEDKPAQPEQGGLESFWVQRSVGNSQVFPKQDSQSVYAVTALKNVFWPGWITIGYANGYSNFYLGNGLKVNQSCWDNFCNSDLQEDCQETQEFPEPNPKELPKVEEPQEDGQNAGQQDPEDQ